jgi:hypothetical protein
MSDDVDDADRVSRNNLMKDGGDVASVTPQFQIGVELVG